MSFYFLSFSLILCAINIRGSNSATSNVVELTPANFKTLVTNTNSTWIVEFYMPGCPYCQDFAPTYEQVGRELDGSNIKVGRMDAVQYDNFSNKYDIHGYPTVKIFRPSSPLVEDYDGPRVANKIIEAAKSISSKVKKKEDYVQQPMCELIKKPKN